MGHAHQKKRQRFKQRIFAQHLAVQKLNRVFGGGLRSVGQPHVVPAEVLLAALVCGSFHIARVGGKVQKRMLKNLACVIALGELRHRVVHRLVFLMLQLQRHDGQAVEEENEINLLLGIAEIEVRAKGDAVLAVILGGGTMDRTRLGVIQAQLQRTHLQAAAQQHPQRRVLQRLAQRLEHLIARVGAVVIGQLLERIGLSVHEKGPQLFFSQAVYRVGNVALLQHAIAVHADKKVCNVLLEFQFRG